MSNLNKNTHNTTQRNTTAVSLTAVLRLWYSKKKEKLTSKMEGQGAKDYRLRIRNALQLVTVCANGERFKAGPDQDTVK